MRLGRTTANSTLLNAMLALIAVLIALAASAGVASAATWPRAGFTESPATADPKFPDVSASAVRVHAPLPASFGARPAACDYLTFLRLRHVGGPVDPADADRVLTAQPGVLEGASAFLPVGSNFVHRAWSEQQKNVEFWAIDRRPNCLEDTFGLDYAKSNNDVKAAIDYYFRRTPIAGHKFAGFYTKNSPEVRWMAKQGMDQTVRDWNEINTRALPDQAARQAKLYCGGHSLGGIITGVYANYDFDGNPATTGDAGYNQCAGYFGLDTFISDDMIGLRSLAGPLGLSGLLDGVGGVSDAALQNGVLAPFVDVPAINPEVMLFLSGLGLSAKLEGANESTLVNQMPLDDTIKTAFKILLSRDLSGFLSGKPSPTDFRWTGQAMLGAAIDDNSEPLSIVQTSVGFFSGGPVADKNFPVPNIVGAIPGMEWLTRGLIGTGHLAIPTDYGWHCRWVIFCGYTPGTGPLYKWRNYNDVGSGIPRDSLGRRYTDLSEEVADINDLANGLSATPMNFVEIYFPIKLTLDSMTGMMGSSAAAPGDVHAGGVDARPKINIIAGGGPMRGMAQLISPNSPVVPGYQHLDVLSAAPVQNNGQPEQVVSHLLDFVF